MATRFGRDPSPPHKAKLVTSLDRTNAARERSKKAEEALKIAGLGAALGLLQAAMAPPPKAAASPAKPGDGDDIDRIPFLDLKVCLHFPVPVTIWVDTLRGVAELGDVGSDSAAKTNADPGAGSGAGSSSPPPPPPPPRRFLFLMEPDAITGLAKRAVALAGKFDRVFSHDPSIIEAIGPGRSSLFEHGGSWIPPKTLADFPPGGAAAKAEAAAVRGGGEGGGTPATTAAAAVTFVCGAKRRTRGHRLRQAVWAEQLSLKKKTTTTTTTTASDSDRTSTSTSTSTSRDDQASFGEVSPRFYLSGAASKVAPAKTASKSSSAAAAAAPATAPLLPANLDCNPTLGGRPGAKVDLFTPQNGEAEQVLFHVAIENVRQPHYFTEKLLDCFLTNTMPIYWGCPNIGAYFDTSGMIIITDEDEEGEKGAKEEQQEEDDDDDDNDESEATVAAGSSAAVATTAVAPTKKPVTPSTPPAEARIADDAAARDKILAAIRGLTVKTYASAAAAIDANRVAAEAWLRLDTRMKAAIDEALAAP